MVVMPYIYIYICIMLFLSHLVRVNNDIIYVYIYMYVCMYIYTHVFWGGVVIFPKKKCLEDDSCSLQCFLIFQVQYTKINCPGLQRRHVFVEPMASSTHLSPSPKHGPLKELMVSVKELSFPTLGIICWRWCSDLWVVVGWIMIHHILQQFDGTVTTCRLVILWVPGRVLQSL